MKKLSDIPRGRYVVTAILVLIAAVIYVPYFLGLVSTSTTEMILIFVLEFAFAMAMLEILSAYADRTNGLNNIYADLSAYSSKTAYSSMQRTHRVAFFELAIIFIATVVTPFLGFSLFELTAALVISFACDIFAYLCGNFIKSPKVRALSHISPNKSVAGFIGGYLGGILLGFVMAFIFDHAITVKLVIFLCLASLIAILGDLTASAAKRNLHIKDSGEILSTIPFFTPIEKVLSGHGGFLDRFDSVAAVICLATIFKLF